MVFTSVTPRVLTLSEVSHKHVIPSIAKLVYHGDAIAYPDGVGGGYPARPSSACAGIRRRYPRGGDEIRTITMAPGEALSHWNQIL
jgi:hypothetical protein